MARVLIVDDNETDRLFEKTILEDKGHQLYFARNGEEAIRLYLRQGIEVVVTDLHMPFGDGMELIEAITGLYPDARIIAVSGTGPEELGMAKLIGAALTLPKPVDPRTLIDAVEEMAAQA